ncbi:MAG: GlsB/YeaQ/YmgE family stress response membrane protein [Actinobacteria bacterium]|nr:GlsB/YeaQ/YmgE family stress response membrane protein [Actinomycetota bacterium]
MSIIAWIVLGGAAGWIASIFAGVGKKMGCLLNIFAGITGAVVGGALFRYFGHEGVTGFDWWSLLVASVGALVILLGIRLIGLLVKRD